MVEMVGGRYTYLSTVEPDDLVDGLVKQCQILTTKHNDKELTGGKGQQSTTAWPCGSVLTYIGGKVIWLSRNWKYPLILCVLLAGLACFWLVSVQHTVL